MDIQIIAFLVAIAFILVSIIKFKLHPFFALLFGTLIMGVVTGMSLTDILAQIIKGFGGISGEIGIIIFLGVVLGQILHDSGSTKQIARKMLSLVGKKRAPLAANLTGYIISIPVFFDVAFIILIGLLKQISAEGKIALNVMVTAFVVGVAMTHAMVIPTPGPVAVAGIMGADIGWFIVYGALTALPASLVGGLLYTKWLAKRPIYVRDEEYQQGENKNTADAVEVDDSKLPSGSQGIFFVLLPLLLIIFGNILKALVTEGTALHNVISFCSDTIIVLLFTVFVVLFALKKYINKPFEALTTEACNSVGAILAIIGIGGSFGAVISGSGVGDSLVTLLGTLNMPVMLLGFLLAMCIHAALGSMTAALVTSSAVIAPIVTQMGADPVLCGLAVCAGAIGLGLPSDGGFWMVCRFAQFTTKETFFVFTIPLTIAAVVAMLILTVFSLLGGILPGIA